MQNAPVGLIGIGLVGTALAERLLASRIDVVGFDISSQQRSALDSLGGRSVPAPDLLGSCPRLILSLPDSTIARDVVDSIMTWQDVPHTVIDTTTGDPDDMVALGEKLGAGKIAYLDATIAGSSQHVREGKAVALVGGDKSIYDANQDIWASFTAASFHVGRSGSGARMKLAVNLVIGLNRAVLAEGLAFAKSLGLSETVALEIFKATPAYSAMMDSKGEKMIHGDFTPQARLAQHLKDVGLILKHGAAGDASLPLSSLHRELLQQLVDQGNGELDNSAIAKAFGL